MCKEWNDRTHSAHKIDRQEKTRFGASGSGSLRAACQPQWNVSFAYIFFAFLSMFLFVFISVVCACGVVAPAAACEPFGTDSFQFGFQQFASPAFAIKLLLAFFRWSRHRANNACAIVVNSTDAHNHRQCSNKIPLLPKMSKWFMRDHRSRRRRLVVIKFFFVTFSLKREEKEKIFEYIIWVRSGEEDDTNIKLLGINASHMQNVCDNCFSHSSRQQQQLRGAIFTGSLSTSAGSGPNEQRRTWNDMHMQPFGVALSAETQQHVPFASIFGPSMLRSFVRFHLYFASIGTWLLLLFSRFSFFFGSIFIFSCATKNRCYENVFDRYREEKQIMRKCWTIVCIVCDFPMKWLKIKIGRRNWMLTLGKSNWNTRSRPEMNEWDQFAIGRSLFRSIWVASWTVRVWRTWLGGMMPYSCSCGCTSANTIPRTPH